MPRLISARSNESGLWGYLLVAAAVHAVLAFALKMGWPETTARKLPELVIELGQAEPLNAQSAVPPQAAALASPPFKTASAVKAGSQTARMNRQAPTPQPSPVIESAGGMSKISPAPSTPPIEPAPIAAPSVRVQGQDALVADPSARPTMGTGSQAFDTTGATPKALVAEQTAVEQPVLPAIETRLSGAHSDVQAASQALAVPAPPGTPVVRDNAARTVEVDYRAAYLNNAPPAYPRAARRQGITGTVILIAEVSEQGRPGQIRVLQSSGNPLLDQSALSAVTKWQFSPAQRDGKPVAATVKIPITFSLLGAR